MRMQSADGRPIIPSPDNISPDIASANVTNQQLDSMKNNTKGRWVIGWPIVGNIAISQALSLLAAGPVDIFSQAIKADAAVFGSFVPGQAPWNNLLSDNGRTTKAVWPQAGGLYISDLWNHSSGPASAVINLKQQIYENLVIVPSVNNNPDAYIPGISFPPGIGFARGVATTNANTTEITENFEGLLAGLRESKPNEAWSKDTQLNMQLQPTIPLKTLIASLTTQLTPVGGARIQWIGYGLEARPIVTGT